jgi:redox-sensing transcriptional repressor
LTQTTDNRPVVQLPRPTLERLPTYHRCISAAVVNGEQFISSAELGRRLNIDEAQVRRDLSLVWGKGRPGLGYEAASLITRLDEVLGYNNVADAVLVGAGRLGRALYAYPGFKRYGLEIAAVFDVDSAVIGQMLQGGAHGEQVVLSAIKMPDLVRRMHIQLGIITVPADSAQLVANDMIKAGIRAIWNFAPIRLKVPNEVMVRHEDLAIGLATLSYHLTHTPTSLEL